jgi:hypothetical protein
MARSFIPCTAYGSSLQVRRLAAYREGAVVLVPRAVQLMLAYLRRPDLLGEDWVAPWRQAA